MTFKSHIDGSTHRFTPEKSIAIQENLGADIIMAFDECSDPNDHTYTQKAMDRTHRWAERSVRAKTREDQALFGIVQGGVHAEMRAKSAQFIASLDTPGIAIGGLSVGETKEEMHAMLDVVLPILPEGKPRYLMGVGTPEDLINAVLRGVDNFDCVLPTRLPRHHSAFTPEGRLNVMNAAHSRDPRPIDESCDCYACRTFSRAYIRQLTLIFAVLRKELALQLLLTLAIARHGADAGDLGRLMTHGQIFTYALVNTLWIPCAATVAVLAPELGWKRAAAISLFTVGLALAVGGVARRIGGY